MPDRHWRVLTGGQLMLIMVYNFGNVNTLFKAGFKKEKIEPDEH